MYSLTWSFQNVARICHFEFLDPLPPHTNKLGGYNKIFRPPTLVNISWNLALLTLRPPTQFVGGGIEKFLTHPTPQNLWSFENLAIICYFLFRPPTHYNYNFC